MHMKRIHKILSILAIGLLVTSCGGKKENSSSLVDSSVGSSSPSTSEASSSSSSVQPVKPDLTEAMFDVFDTEYIAFDGTDEVAFYDIRTNKFYQSNTMNVSTSMDGQHWSATYEDSATGAERTLYYADHDGVACEVSVSLMNDEEYTPMLDDDGNEILWADAGLTNALNRLSVSDFTYNEETGRYHYNKTDFSLIDAIVSSANPYEFTSDDFSLIISDGEIIGIQVSSTFDTTLAAGYKAEQTLIATINYGEEAVTVPTISKFSYDSDYHVYLSEALTNMQALKRYNTKVKIYAQSIYYSAVSASGYFETVTEDDCYFQTMNVATTTDQEDTPEEGSAYGFHRFSETEYNSFMSEADGSLAATRAYRGSLDLVKPSFAFAPEIMTGIGYDQNTKEYYYYSDSNMCSVASTFYYGVGNDINTYSIFATTGQTSATDSFTPYVVTTQIDGKWYITYSCFYFNLGLMHGVMEITYSDFDSATLPENVSVDFAKREIPSSWNDLTFIKSDDSSSTTEDDTEVNAGEFLKEFYADPEILDKMPFFGGVDYLGDCFGFGLAGSYRPDGMAYYVNAITLYYDVPLDLNYSIDASLKKVYQCLTDAGFTDVGNHVYVKGDITVEPKDVELDLTIYVYRTSDNPNLTNN